MVIGRKFLGSKGLPLFLYISQMAPDLPTREEEHLSHEPLDNVNFEQLNEGINTYISQEEILFTILQYSFGSDVFRFFNSSLIFFR
jgi:hypothetical protein